MSQIFNYRPPRFPAELPIELHFDGTIFHGRCRSISLTGTSAVLTFPVVAGQSGTLVLRSSSREFHVGVLVTHSDGLQAGLEFVFRTPQEQQIIRTIVSALCSR